MRHVSNIFGEAASTAQTARLSEVCPTKIEVRYGHEMFWQVEQRRYEWWLLIIPQGTI